MLVGSVQQAPGHSGPVGDTGQEVPGTAPAGPTYTVAVRALCEFTAKRGDLDLRFTPSPTGAQGIEGHGTVTARRPAGYQREVPLEGVFETLRVRGRADGGDLGFRARSESCPK